MAKKTGSVIVTVSRCQKQFRICYIQDVPRFFNFLFLCHLQLGENLSDVFYQIFIVFCQLFPVISLSLSFLMSLFPHFAALLSFQHDKNETKYLTAQSRANLKKKEKRTTSKRRNILTAQGSPSTWLALRGLWLPPSSKDYQPICG